MRRWLIRSGLEHALICIPDGCTRALIGQRSKGSLLLLWFNEENIVWCDDNFLIKKRRSRMGKKTWERIKTVILISISLCQSGSLFNNPEYALMLYKLILNIMLCSILQKYFTCACCCSHVWARLSQEDSFQLRVSDEAGSGYFVSCA